MHGYPCTEDDVAMVTSKILSAVKYIYQFGIIHQGNSVLVGEIIVLEFAY